MKQIFCTAMVIGLFLVNSTIAHSRELIVGLSPNLERAESKEQVKAVIGFLLETLEPGDTARIYDAYHLKSLGTFEVPNKEAYRHKKAKLAVNKKAVRILLQFADKAQYLDGTRPSVRGALRLPQFLRFLGENLSLAQETDLIILGSSLYDIPEEKEFSMAEGHVPSDGHLQVPFGQSPFGMTANREVLRNLRVHLGHSTQDFMQGDHQKFFVKRFWTLFLEKQAGKLITFTSDLPTLFERVKNQVSTPKHDYELQPTTKLEMILYRPNAVEKKVSIYDHPLSKKPVSLAALKNARNVEVSITWECKNCDLDLYARPNPKAKIIYFHYPETKEGRYIKDFRGSPQLSNSYETIIFHQPVDLTQLTLAINFYGGKVRDRVKGQFRILVDKKTFAQDFQIKATSGNKGACIMETLKRQKATASQCLIIDPMRAIKVRK